MTLENAEAARPADQGASLYVHLSRLNPIALLVIYALMIPAFGGIYWALGQQKTQQFYAQYAKYEPAADTDAAAVEDNLRRGMLQSYKTHATLEPEWLLDPNVLHATNFVRTDDGSATFTVWLSAARVKAGKLQGMTGGPNAGIRLGRERMIVGQGDQRIICHIATLPPTTPALAAFDFDLRPLFRAPDATGLQADAACFDVSQENQFERLLAGLNGDPRPLSGFFGRMVYFSATTITTVGFGDIVPLTGMARLVVALEAVVGWLLAGLFLNAVAWRAAHLAPRLQAAARSRDVE